MIKVSNIARKIKNLNIKFVDENLNNINEDLKKIKRIRRKNIGTDPNSLVSELNVFSEYTKMLFLSELITYEKVKKNIGKNREYLKNIFEYVGTIDALIGVASFRESLDYFTIPNLTKRKNYIEFKEMYHPLIQNPVTNSGSFEKSALITGSNASGKSTFIKSVAINAILAQSINTCCAKEYNGSYFKVYTSMALKDDVLSKESYYIVEIKSLKRILDSIDDNIPTLCFVDEILRGTNTIERIASSSEVLSSLSENNCTCFAATHDIELTYLLEDKFDNYHFEENITDNDIKFDSKLYSGRAQSRNAIKLLGFMGYSEDIVSRAKERAEMFVATGKW
ncbi:MutS-related protein [Romboutsia sp. Marseille-P6047]|uniref:MutS-related protein n=1 Tax=Romboutsia sp. Marseille-P6047 TaxID=2161817 RepID=UPI001FAAB9F4|nr:DNA mismatch repair protein MutS [Romboutsia sp. Marseille-P6047]